jgi:hypothetical protein
MIYHAKSHTEISAKQILSEMKKKSDGKFPIKKIQSADFDRVGRVRGNKLIFNFGLSITKMSDMSITVICHGMSHIFLFYILDRTDEQLQNK